MNVPSIYPESSDGPHPANVTAPDVTRVEGRRVTPESRIMLLPGQPESSLHFEIFGWDKWDCEHWGCTPADPSSPAVPDFIKKEGEWK